MIISDLKCYQGTVAKKISFAGVGLHTGKLVELNILPAEANTGIRFLRTDIEDADYIPAHPDYIVDTTLCTTIGTNAESRVSTIEHLMAAFAGLGVDNALVEVSACELPILDGSSAPFVDKISEVGIQIQNVKRPIVYCTEAIELRIDDQFVRLEPIEGKTFEDMKQSPELQIVCSIDFPTSTVIGYQAKAITFSKSEFMSLSEARTFCHMRDVERMRAHGLAQGGSLDNSVVVDDDRIMNNDGLRYEDEFVRHKMLDCIGDLAMLGVRLSGKLTLHKAGHSLHAKFMNKLLQSPNVLGLKECKSTFKVCTSSTAQEPNFKAKHAFAP